MLGNQRASAQSCVEDEAGKPLACSGNEVRVTFADNVRDPSGASLTQCIKGAVVSFIADFYVQTTAKSAYDVGLFFATDGDPNKDGARSGTCSASTIKGRHLDPSPPNAVMLGAAAAANLDGDACLDVNSQHGWRHIGGKVVTARVDNALCIDSDGDGSLNLPICASWSPDAGEVCNSPANTAPKSPSNCRCDIGFNVPIFVAPPSIQVTKDAPEDLADDARGDLSLLSESDISRESHP